MKTKNLLITAVFALFVASGLRAQGGERVYIRITWQTPTGKARVNIYESGKYQQLGMDKPNFNKKVIDDGDGVVEFGDMFEKYLKVGYKILSTNSSQNGTVSDYILEKP